jgi:hypothetical protein
VVCFFWICFDMADANARLERIRRCNAVRGNTEPIIYGQHVSAEEEEEEDLESSYLPFGRTEPLLSFTATATSRARSGSQLAPAQALAMAQELLRYQPTADGREGWRARIADLVAIANEDPTLGGAQGVGEPDPAARHRAPGSGDGKAAQAKKVVSRAASSPRGEPSCQIVQRAPEDARVSLERCREKHDRAIDDIGEAGKNVTVTGEPVYNPGALLSLASNATWSGPTSSGRTSTRVMMGPPTLSSFSSSTSSSFRPCVEISA